MIRKFKVIDTEKIIDVWKDSIKKAYHFVDKSFLDAETEKIRDIYLPNANTFVYVLGGSIVGFISMIGSEIGGLFVKEKMKGKGIGAKLIDYVSNKSGDKITLEVFSNNHIAIAFYKKYGFVSISEYYHKESEQMMLRMKYKK